MKAATIHQFGGINEIHVEEVAMPTISSNEVLVKVIASSINQLDWRLRAGEITHIPITFPHTLGWDLSGVIMEVGSEVSKFKVGDAIYSRPEVAKNGSHAEYIAIDANDVAFKPATISFAAAATLPIASITAWRSLFNFGELEAGQKVLIHAGAGSLGCIAIQLAKNAGAYVITTATAKQHDFVKSLGADEAIDYETEHFQDMLSNIDIVLDTIGDQVQLDSYSVLKPNGILVAVNKYPDMEKAQSLGVQAKFLVCTPDGELLKKVAALVDAGKVRPIVGYEYALKDIHKAYELSESKKAKGKIVIHIAKP